MQLLAQVAMAFARQRLTSTPVVGKVVEQLGFRSHELRGAGRATTLLAQLRWKKTHGWIEPECSIDHPDIGKHQGRGAVPQSISGPYSNVLVNDFADVGDAILHHGDSAMYEFFARSC